MDLVFATTWAKLFQIHTVRVVSTILLRNIVAFFAFRARHRDLGAYITCFLRHHLLLVNPFR